jgi:hypothetical protein
MMRRPPLAVIRALLIAAAMAATGTGAHAAGDAPKDTTAQAGTPFGGQTIPLGAPRPSVPVILPADRNAFPADILARMREALVDRSGNARARPATAQQGND